MTEPTVPELAAEAVTRRLDYWPAHALTTAELEKPTAADLDDYRAAEGHYGDDE